MRIACSEADIRTSTLQLLSQEINETVIMFPSTYMYPTALEAIKKGKRQINTAIKNSVLTLERRMESTNVHPSAVAAMG